MAITDVFKRAVAGELRLSRGHVAAIEPDGRVRVSLEPLGAREVVCNVLRTGAEPAPGLRPGDEVIVATANESASPGVILGTLSRVSGEGGLAATEAHAATSGVTSSASSRKTMAAPAIEPDKPLRLDHREIVIEAGEELTLRCGEASIRITRDGKIVLRGEHILSRAKGTQRIKGGSVAIN